MSRTLKIVTSCWCWILLFALMAYLFHNRQTGRSAGQSIQIQKQENQNGICFFEEEEKNEGTEAILLHLPDWVRAASLFAVTSVSIVWYLFRREADALQHLSIYLFIRNLRL